ncbi:MAG: DegV family protein [Clostridia bacterium]|nr:DegV family protein [Clostridia bacterium]
MIKIVVDSSADCNLQDGIVDVIVPILVSIDNVEYKSGTELTNDKFYELLKSAKEFPRTSQPSPQDFIDLFEKAQNDKDQIIYLCLSSRLSGTYQSALMIKDMVGYDDIYVIDTLGATHIIDVLARYARGLIQKGYSAGEIVDMCEELKHKVKLYAGIDTLEYLYKGGRVSRASATVGEITGVKPLITVSDGRVEMSGKALGKSRAVSALIEKVKNHQINTDFPVFSLYTYGTENCELLEEKLKSLDIKVAERLQVGATIGAHVGPGGYAVLFVEK